jgi:hypothetical protein
MPHFFFTVFNGTGVTIDEEGRELPGIEAARDIALAGIRSIIGEEAKEGRIDLRGRLEVSNSSGDTLFTIGFPEAFELSLGPPPEDLSP